MALQETVEKKGILYDPQAVEACLRLFREKGFRILEGKPEPALGSSGFDRSSLIVLTFDEGTTDRSCCGSPPLASDGRIATVLISPLVKPGFRDETPYSHYSLLKTIAAAWGQVRSKHRPISIKREK